MKFSSMTAMSLLFVCARVMAQDAPRENICARPEASAALVKTYSSADGLTKDHGKLVLRRT
jgi:hypothetical protein